MTISALFPTCAGNSSVKQKNQNFYNHNNNWVESKLIAINFVQILIKMPLMKTIEEPQCVQMIQ